MEQVENDCPVCYGENLLEGRTAVCRNGHRLCAECQPHVQSVLNWRSWGAPSAQCPMCREPIPYIPALVVPRITYIPARVVPRPEPVITEVRVRRRDPQETEERRERAIQGIYQNVETRAEARMLFRNLRENRLIPGNAMFGGVHQRKCGVRTCERMAGSGGVRFLMMNGGKRKYRCESCYYAETGDTPADPPAFVVM